MNAIDAYNIGLVNEIIDNGNNAKYQLIKNIKTKMSMYKMVKISIPLSKRV